MADDLSEYGTVVPASGAPSTDLSEYGTIHGAPTTLPPIGHRLAPPGTALRKQQNAEAAKLPPSQQPGARMADEMLGAIPLVAGGIAAAGTGGLAAIPAAAAGAAAGSTAEQVYRGASGVNPPESFTDAAEQVAKDALYKGAIPEATGKLISWGVGKLGDLLPASFRARIGLAPKTPEDPIPTFHQALSPTPSDIDFEHDTERAVPLVKEMESVMGRQIGARPEAGATAVADIGSRPGAVARDVQSATKLAKQAAYSRWQFAAGPYIDSSVKSDAVADEIESLITPGMKKEDPARAAQLLQEAAKYRGQTYTVEEAAERAAAHNAELRAYYKAPDDATRAAMAATTDPIITKAKADGFRHMIYQPFQDAVESAATPAEKATAVQRLTEAQDARKDYGALDSFLENIERRINPASREQPPTLLGQAFKAVRAGVQAHSGNIVAAHGTVSSMGASDIDNLLIDAFKNIKPADSRVTANLPYRKMIAAPSDTSGPTGFKPWSPEHQEAANAMHAAQPKGLPEPTIKAPPVDFMAQPSGIKVTTGEPLRAPVSRQLPAAGRSDLPHTADETSHGGPREGVPVFDKDGKVEYYITQPKYTSGALVKLRNGQSVRIGKINDDDTFEYTGQ